MMQGTHSPTPVMVIGRHGAARRQCIALLGASEQVQIVAAGATMCDVAVPDLANRQRGVVVFCGELQAATATIDRDMRMMREAAPAWPILAISHPPALLHPHLAGWLSLSSPIDLVAAIQVVASGGWVCERVAELALLHKSEPVRAQVGRAA